MRREHRDAGKGVLAGYMEAGAPAVAGGGAGAPVTGLYFDALILFMFI